MENKENDNGHKDAIDYFIQMGVDKEMAEEIIIAAEGGEIPKNPKTKPEILKYARYMGLEFLPWTKL